MPARSQRSFLPRYASGRWAEAVILLPSFLALGYHSFGRSDLLWILWGAGIAAAAVLALLRLKRAGPADAGAVAVLLIAALLLANRTASLRWPLYFLLLPVAAARFSGLWHLLAAWSAVALLEAVQARILPTLLGFSGTAARLALLGLLAALLYIFYLRRQNLLRDSLKDHLRLREEAEGIRKYDALRTGPALESQTAAGKEARRVSAVVELDRHLDRLLTLTRRALEARTVALYRRDGNRLGLRGASKGLAAAEVRESFRLGEGIIGGAANLQQSLLVESLDRRGRRGGSILAGLPSASLMAVPVKEQGVLVGVLVAEHPQPERFSRSEMEVFESFALEVNLVIENFRESSMRDRRSATMESLCVLSDALSSTLKPEDMIDSLVDRISGIIPYDQCAVFLRDAERKRLVLNTQRGFRFESPSGIFFPQSKGLVGYIVSHRQPLLFSDRKKMEIIPGYTGLEKMRSFMGMPLRFREDFDGAIVFASARPGRFTHYHMETLKLLANQAAAQLSNAFLHQEVERMALTDGLTGLYNHRHFQERLAYELERAERHGQSLSLLLIDIDHFKKINDAHGHPFGDRVLKGVAAQLTKMARAIDFVARYGGEEFAVILPGTGRRGCRTMANRVLKVVRAASFDCDGGPLSVTVSVGSATYPEEGADKEELVRYADQALYGAKNSGRDRYLSHRDAADV